ncbi:MAG: hypothetical protein Q8L54_12230 [Devosia sp.]|nr:hypothetical protein [Devosia sp.]
MRVSQALVHEIEGYGVTTAQIIYHLPDHLELLQEFVWQEYDLFPQFPGLNKFLTFWERKLDGPLHSVTVAHKLLVRPSELTMLRGTYRLQ